MAKKDIRIEPVDNGGFIVHHSSPDSSIGKYQPPSKHIFSNQMDMLTHVHKMTGGTKPATFKEALQKLTKK